MAGRLLLVLRLLRRDLRGRRTETALLLVAITAATATLTLGLTLHELASRPYERTRAATGGPDLVIEPGVTGPAALDALTTVTARPDVTGWSGPYPLLFLSLNAGELTSRVVVQGRDEAPVAIDQPAVLDGGWVRPGGAVLELAFADAFGLRVGDPVTINGRVLRVEGLAVTAARAPFPNVNWHVPSTLDTYKGGAVWVHRDDIPALAGGQPLSYNLNVTIADPELARAFTRLPSGEKNLAYRGWHIRPWQDFVDSAGRRYGALFEALLVGSWLLTGLAVTGVAGIVGGRVIAQRRRVGLLKAVGAGPGLIAVLHLLEYLVIGVVAAGTGLTVGWLAAPVLFRPSVGLIGTVGTAPPPAGLVWTVLGLALTIAVTATLGQVLRAATTDTVHALADSAAPPDRRSLLIGLSRRLPPALLLGVRITARRPRRARLTTVNTLITMTSIAAVLTGLAQRPGTDDLGGMTVPDTGGGRLRYALMLLVVLVCVLALLNTIVSTWTAALDARAPLAVARALGATPAQAGLGLAISQLLPALPGVALGLLFGIGLYRFANESYGDEPYAPAWWMALAATAVLLALAALTALPAVRAARRPVADTLR
ncbi:ABC transporter permease [Catenuloplanes atrovinosus]|uniref:ABC transport system permease protein n=1 Tax=Catenuloplanes atrovinosus TaxID=137266 RepID=A0AAE4C8Y0_9ACTN|nr:FtsX-like permease family protein [Catenuloplanes atrovinosus]MDR7275112.1 putative ABC transport system permease protein [Catenuloplanes atrovinosus]